LRGFRAVLYTEWVNETGWGVLAAWRKFAYKKASR